MLGACLLVDCHLLDGLHCIGEGEEGVLSDPASLLSNVTVHIPNVEEHTGVVVQGKAHYHDKARDAEDTRVDVENISNLQCVCVCVCVCVR